MTDKYGGKGNDEYRLTAGSKNTIKDTDNIGSVYKGSQQLTGARKDDYKGNNVWIKNGVKYNRNEGSHILLINGGLATIKDFKNGALGITLEKPEDEPEPPEKADNDMTEPIVLDLDGNGFGTTNVSNGVYFDHENDGFAEASAWVGRNDGILVVDSNNNDEIGFLRLLGKNLTNMTIIKFIWLKNSKSAKCVMPSKTI